MKFGVNHKLRILLILIVLLVLLFVSIFLDSSIRKYYFNREVDSLLEKGQSLALKLGHSESLSDYKEEIRFLSEFIGADIIIINRDKKIVVCSEGHHLDNGMYMDWEELKEIFQGKSFIHHEIRTPLSIMQGYTEALLDGMADTPEDNNTYLLIIKDEIIRLRVLVDDLLDLNKMEAGNFALKKDYYDVERLLKRVKRKYSSFQDNTDISIELTIQPDIPLIYGDERRIEQALINLVENAIRHTPDGGRIIISAFCEDAKLTLQVTDNGEGIPYNELPYIWDRFFKVDKARTREKAGSGLGLAIVKNIIEAHE